MTGPLDGLIAAANIAKQRFQDGASPEIIRQALDELDALIDEDNLRALAGDEAVNEVIRGVAQRGKTFNGAANGQHKPSPAEARQASIVAVPYMLPEANMIPRRLFLYGKQYLRGEVSTTIAAGGRAKTTLLLVEALGMVVGRNLMTGVALEGVLRVWVINAEEDQNELDRRIAAICQHYNITREDIGGRLHVTSLKGKEQWHIAVLNSKGEPVVNIPVVEKISAEISEKNIDATIMDPLVSFHCVNESDNIHMDVVIKTGLGGIATKTKTSVHIAHHTGKPKPGQPDSIVEDSRGASAIVWAARINRVLNLMSTQEAKTIGINEAERRQYVRIDAGAKGNPVPPEKAVWAKLYPIKILNGDEVATLIPWSPPNPLENLAPDIVYRVRELAATGGYRKDSRSPEWFGLAIAPLIGVSLKYGPGNDRKDIVKANGLIKMWLANKVLAEDERTDEKYRKRIFLVPGPWNDHPANTAKANEIIEPADDETFDASDM